MYNSTISNSPDYRPPMFIVYGAKVVGGNTSSIGGRAGDQKHKKIRWCDGHFEKQHNCHKKISRMIFQSSCDSYDWSGVNITGIGIIVLIYILIQILLCVKFYFQITIQFKYSTCVNKTVISQLAMGI